jgi:hypothetical protein
MSFAASGRAADSAQGSHKTTTGAANEAAQDASGFAKTNPWYDESDRSNVFMAGDRSARESSDPVARIRLSRAHAFIIDLYEFLRVEHDANIGRC